MRKVRPTQSRIESVVEAVLNVGSGMLVAFLLWRYVVRPVWGYEGGAADDLAIAALFTIASVVRTYVWRRLFEGRARRAVARAMR